MRRHVAPPCPCSAARTDPGLSRVRCTEPTLGLRTKSFFGTPEPSRCVAELRTILRCASVRSDADTAGSGAEESGRRAEQAAEARRVQGLQQGGGGAAHSRGRDGHRGSRRGGAGGRRRRGSGIVTAVVASRKLYRTMLGTTQRSRSEARQLQRRQQRAVKEPLQPLVVASRFQQPRHVCAAAARFKEDSTRGTRLLRSQAKPSRCNPTGFTQGL